MTAEPKHFPGFEHEGMQIVNPTASPCGGRFVVSPEYYGFEIWQTGGGCTGWGKVIDDGAHHVLLTDLSGTSHVLGEVCEHFLVGLIGQEDGYQVGIWTMQVGLIYDEDDQPENENAS